jgi:hypothetical protein
MFAARKGWIDYRSVSRTLTVTFLRPVVMGSKVRVGVEIGLLSCVHDKAVFARREGCNVKAAWRGALGQELRLACINMYYFRRLLTTSSGLVCNKPSSLLIQLRFLRGQEVGWTGDKMLEFRYWNPVTSKPVSEWIYSRLLDRRRDSSSTSTAAFHR